MTLVFALINSAVIVSVLLAVFGWSRRPALGAGTFALLMLATAQWSLGVSLGLASPDLATKMLWAKFVFIGIAAVPLLWLILSAEYTGQARWLTRRVIVLLGLEPLVTVALAWTNEAHGLIYTSTRLVMVNDQPMVEATFGVWAWVHTLYSYALVLAGTLLLIWAIIRLPPFFQSQAWTVLVAAFVPWISNIISVFRLSPFPLLDLTPIAFGVSGVAFGWAFFRLRLLEIVPVARDLAIENMSDGLIVVDAHARIVDINPAVQDILGLSPRQIVGHLAERVLPTWGGLIDATRRPGSFSTEIVIAAGEQARAYDMRITPLFDHQRRLNGHVAILRNITDYKTVKQELEHAKEQAEAAGRAKSAFLATAGYELRTPLAMITGYSRTLLNEARARDLTSFVGYLDKINSASRQLLLLVNNLLELTKIEMGAMPLTPRIFDLASLVREVVATSQPLAEEKGNTLELRTDGVMGMNSDRDKIQQVLFTLVENACKFTRHGSICVQLSHEAMNDMEWVTICVSDTGVGIAPAHLRQLFEPFAQADTTAAREPGTTGLSLALSQRYCAMMGGALEVASELGHGSVFTVRLPLRVEPPAKSANARRVWLSD